MEVEFSFPTASEPGWLKRQLEFAEFEESLASMTPAEQLRATVKMLALYVTQPKDKVEDAVWALSKPDFDAVMEKLKESQTNPNSSGPSGAGGGAKARKRRSKH